MASHPQCSDSTAAAVLLQTPQRPADHHARAQVDDNRQVQPTFGCFKVGDVADQLGGGHRCIEIPLYEIRAQGSIGSRDSGAL
jgi:hypothetical protein